MKTSTRLLRLTACAGFFLGALHFASTFASDPETPAELTVTNNVAAPDPQPFGLNELVGPKGFNNASRDATLCSMEPRYFRQKFFVSEVGMENGKDWFSSPNLSSGDTYQDGFWNGADVRVYRRSASGPYERVQTDKVSAFKSGRDFWAIIFWPNSRLPNGNVLNDSVVLADPGKSGEFTDGRLCQWYQQTDLRNGKTVYYVVRSISKDGVESDNSNVASATPLASINNGPKITKTMLNLVDKTPDGSFKPYDDHLEASGGTPPLHWEVVEAANLPPGLSSSEKTINGRNQLFISGQPTTSEKASFKVRVTDSANRSDERVITMNLPLLPRPTPKELASLKVPAPPENVTAVANNGSVTIKWKPVDSPDVIGYRVFRSYFPPDQQITRAVLSSGAGKIQKGDLVYFDLEKADIPADQLHDRAIFTRFERDPYHTEIKKPGDTNWTDWKSLPSLDDIPEIRIKHVPHPQPLPPEFTNAGKTCLQLKAENNWGLKVSIVALGPKEQDWYYTLVPGQTYQFDAWMRQDGISAGKVTFQDSRIKEISTDFKVDGTWKKFSYQFSISDWTQRDLDSLSLSFEGGGTLWLDKPIVFDATDSKKTGQPDVPPNGMVPIWKDELRKFYTASPTGPKGVLRYWGGQSNLPGGATLEDILLPVEAQRSTGGGDKQLNLHNALTLMKEVNAEPWLIISSTMSEEEWRNLIEYLAGSPESEYGKRRVADRNGIKTPWTDEFQKIRIECDNETWNFGFAHCFPGDKEKKIDRAEQYGAYAEMLFRAAKSAPAWSAEKLDGKVEFIVGGWSIATGPNGYGHLAAQHSPSTNYVGTAPYLGGWEQGLYLGGKTFNDEGVAQWLLFMPRKHQEQTDAHVATENSLREQKLANYRMVVYEGGPGYDLPGPSNPSGSVAESSGKSLAAAVTTLDCYLYESLKGYGPQAFFGFTPGTRWSSHCQAVEDGKWVLRPQTTFLALSMRNRFASGRMVEVEPRTLPSVDLAAYGKTFKPMSDVPLLGCYAFSDGNKYSVFLLSRKLDVRDSSGKVTDPAITPVTLHLPFASAQKITLHKLAGDPRQSNVPGLPTYSEKNLAIEDVELSPKLAKSTLVVDASTGGVKAGGKEGLPPGSVYVYVFEGTSGSNPNLSKP